MDRHVVIVGGGLSGSLTLLALARFRQPNLRITLVEREPRRLNRGVAYQAEYQAQLLNVRAGNMSLYPDKPEDFIQFLARHPGWTDTPPAVLAQMFIPRSVFGDYLEAEVRAAAKQDGPRIELVTAEVTGVEREKDLFRVLSRDGRQWLADDVVLAPGNCPPSHPCVLPAEVATHPSYVAYPWRQDIFQTLRSDQSVLLVGAGLTTVDHILSLRARGHTGRIEVISRRGWWPGEHGTPKASPLPESLLRIAARTPRGLLRFLRHRASSVDAPAWTDLVDGLRPHVNAIWQQWSPASKRTFLRHLRQLWDIHRHRIPVEHHVALREMAAAGQLHLHAGRVREIKATREGRLMVEISTRSGRGQSVFKPDLIVNCTGPETRWRMPGNAVVEQLLARGLGSSDELGFGLRTDAFGRSLDADGIPVAGLFLLGPVLRGQLWESSALHEIRGQAGLIASDIASRVQLRQPLSRVA